MYNEKSTKHKHTHLDLNIFAVDHLNNTHNIIKDQTQFLTVIWKDNNTNLMSKLSTNRKTIEDWRN